jgi:peptide/nickel transport system permease protein
MKAYIIRRLLLVPVTLFLISVVIFGILRAIPGDVVTMMFAEEGAVYDARLAIELRREFGFERPIHVQYAEWALHMFQGDFGESYWYKRPAWDVLKVRIVPTLEIMVIAMSGGVLFGGFAGILAAVRRDTFVDYIVRSLAVMGLTMPAFVAAVLVLIVLITVFQWTPPARFMYANEDFSAHLSALIWPSLVLAFIMSAGYTRIVRTQMLEVIREDYVRTARAKGLPERIVIARHVLRNAMLPVLGLMGVQVAFLISGSVVTESVFNIPGLGTGLLDAARNRDYTIVQLFVVIMVLIVMGTNLVVDLLYAWIDPRIKYR